MTDRDCIKKIRKCIEDRNMSFIIGAGFSKNISDKFPLWDELLCPMVTEMYPECESKNREKQKRAVRNIIHRIGYLGIASEYVRRKGYHEAIDVYIETHTPYLKKQDNGTFVVMLNDKCIDTQPYLECHKKLLSLGIKNIYTFNYDNTLDIFGGTDIAEKHIDEQNKAIRQLDRHENHKNSYTETVSQLKRQIEELRMPSSESMTGHESIETILQKTNDALKDFDVNLNPFTDIDSIDEKHVENITAFETKKTELESIINSAEANREKVYQLIEKAFQISLTENKKNIYKLHGNLRSSNVNPYGFDNDTHRHYIICKEDYDEYPQKHEAFVNLMKVSLLRGAFCLIGFSGNDPNFLAWIDWVKDVLDKNNERKRKEHTNPIYFINVDDTPLTEDKLLLLKNHYIKPVNLAQEFPTASTPKERILHFLNAIATDKTKYENYKNAWENIQINPPEKLITDAIIPQIDCVYNLAEYNRIPSQTDYSHHRRIATFSKAKKLIEHDPRKVETAKLLYAAIKGELMPLSAVLDNQHLKRLLQDTKIEDQLRTKYALLALRSRILQNQPIDELPKAKEDSLYECIWGELFALRFGKAKQLLDAWNPDTAFNKVRKQILLSVFDDTEIKSEQILNLLQQENFTCIQDYKYALDILPQIRGIFFNDENGHISLDKDVRTRKDWVEQHNPDLIQIWRLINSLQDQITQSENKVPYGNAKKTVKFNTYNVPQVNSTKIIQLFIELGLPTETRNLNFMNKDKWIAVYENIYEYYPYPCLYFTLLYGNSKDIIRKVAQDYIYSHKLASMLPDMLNQMLQTSLDTCCPKNVRDAIYIAAPIFMKAVALERWIDSFKQVYDSFEFTPDFPDRNRISPDYDFIINSVELVHDTEFKQQIINECVTAPAKIDNFHNELLIAASNQLTSLNNTISGKIANLIDVAETPAQFYVLLNTQKVSDKNKLCRKFMSLSEDKYKDITLLTAVSCFAKDFPELKAKLRDIAINSHSLWLTGISKDRHQVSHYGHILDINIIQNDIGFDERQITTIYNKMLIALDAIDDVTAQGMNHGFNLFSNWKQILSIMLQFLRQNKTVLDKVPTYRQSVKKATSLYNKYRGGNKLSELLIDDEHTNNAIACLVNEIQANGVSKYQEEYMLLANKIIMHNSQYLNACFLHFGWVLTKYKEQFKPEIFKPLLKYILDSYKPYFLRNKPKKWDIQYAEKDIVEKELLRIYRVYAKWGGRSVFWSNYTPLYYYPINAEITD